MRSPNFQEIITFNFKLSENLNFQNTLIGEVAVRNGLKFDPYATELRREMSYYLDLYSQREITARLFIH